MSTKLQSTRYNFIGDKNALFTQTEELAAATVPPPNVLYATPPNPASTTSTTNVMAGLGITFTPNKSGKVKVFMSFSLQNNTPTGGAFAQLAYGTGTPPAGGDPQVGTLIGQYQSMTATSNDLSDNTVLFAVITGLTVGTTYWFDIAFRAYLTGIASVLQIMVLIEEF